MSYYITKAEFKVPLSKFDHDTRAIKLENGLDCILITDPNAKSTGVSLSVNSGSNNDGGVEGLAHLMEHIIFTNSKDFPRPYALIQNVRRTGGEVNAFTTFNQTVFYLEVPNTSKSASEINPEIISDKPILSYLLEVFASNLKRPSFNNDLIISEIRDINEEHSMNVSSISKRFYHCLKLISDSTFKSFATGSMETLNLKCKKQLIQYHKDNFIGSNMKLIMKGPQSCNTLQKLVISCFQGINKGNSRTINLPGIFSLKSRKQLLYVNDGANMMRIVFPINNLNDNRIQITKLWIELFGNEEQNSLCDILYQMNLASDVLVFDQFIDFNNLVIIIELKLTKLGKHRVTFILFCITYFILLVTEVSYHQLQRYIDDFLESEKLRFIYKESDNGLMNEITNLTELMNVVQYEHLFFGYRPMRLASKLFISESKRIFHIDNLKIILFSDISTNDFPSIVLNTYDKNYDIKYLIFEIDTLNASSEDHRILKQWLKFPKRNKFLQISGAYIPIPSISEPTLNYHIKYEVDKRPYLIEHSPEFELWFDRGSNYNHRIFTSFEMLTIKSFPNCMDFVALELIAEILGDDLKVKLYSAERIDFSWSIFTALNSSNSLTFNLNGLAMNYSKVLVEFIEIIKQGLSILLTITYSKFVKARVRIRKKYEDLENEESLAQSVGILYCLIDKNVYSPFEVLETIELIELDDVLLVNNKLNNCYTSILINGDCDLETAYEISSTISRLTKHLHQGKLHEPPTFLGSYNPFVRKVRYEYSSQQKHCLFYINLGPRESIYIRTISKLVEFIMSLHVHKLRYPRKLGYKIGSSLRIFRKVIGVFIFIESNEYNFPTLDSNIEDLLHEIEVYVDGLNESEFFEEVLLPCINAIGFTSVSHSSPSIVFDMPPSRSSTNFDLVSGNYFEHKGIWEKIINRIYRFEGKNGNERIDINLLRSISRSEFLRFFENKISPDSESRSIILITNEVNKEQLMEELEIYLTSKKIVISGQRRNQLLELKDIDLIKKELRIQRFSNPKKLNHLYPPAQKEKLLKEIEDYHEYCDPIPMDQHLRALEPFKDNY